MGASVSVSLGLLVLGPEILKISGEQAPLASLLATILYLPLILAFAERSSQLDGSTSVYQIVRASGSARRLFFAGWLLLGGCSAITALLAQGGGAGLYVSDKLIDRVLAHLDDGPTR